MEKKLKKLFDYQRFERNEKLEKLIRETESRYASELSDDDLSLVNAAGETDPVKIDGNISSSGGIYQYGDFDCLDGKSDSHIGSGGGGGGGGTGGNGTAM